MFARRTLLLLVAGSIAATAGFAGNELMREKICLVPFGRTDPKSVEALRIPIEKRFGVDVAVEKPRPVPRDAYNASREQYLSTAFLNALRRKYPKNALRALGVADVDLYVPRLNFVFGEAEMPGRVAVISLTRLRPAYYGQPENEQIFVARTVKEAVHELGHTFNLRHCADSRCVMFFSNSLRDTDRKSADFCTICAGKLSNVGSTSGISM